MIRRKKLVISIAILLGVILITIAIAYAALSTTLTVTMNKTTQNAMTWSIGFHTGTVSGVASNTGNNGSISCGSATATATTISGVNPSFDTANGMCAYTFKIRNNGTIAGKISAITITKPVSSCTTSGSTMTCGNFVYKLRYNSSSSTTLVAVNDTIAAKSGSTATEKTVVLTVEHSNMSGETGAYNQNNFNYQLTFAQY